MTFPVETLQIMCHCSVGTLLSIFSLFLVDFDELEVFSFRSAGAKLSAAEKCFPALELFNQIIRVIHTPKINLFPDTCE